MSMSAATTPAKFLSGTNGTVSVTISAVETEFQVEQADWTVEVAEEDITHSGANGWFVPLGGVRKVSGTLTFVYDLANTPYGAEYALKAGSAAALKLYGNAHQAANLASGDANSSEVWSGSAFIKNPKFKTGPKSGSMECTIEFSSIGPWTGPCI